MPIYETYESGKHYIGGCCVETNGEALNMIMGVWIMILHGVRRLLQQKILKNSY